MQKKIAKFRLGGSPYGSLAAPGFLSVMLEYCKQPGGHAWRIPTRDGVVTAVDGDVVVAYSDGTYKVVSGSDRQLTISN